VRDVLSLVDADSVRHVTLHTPDLDDVFLALTGQAGKAQPRMAQPRMAQSGKAQ